MIWVNLGRLVLTVGLVGACVYLWVVGRKPPDALVMMAGAAAGQYIPTPRRTGGTA